MFFVTWFRALVNFTSVDRWAMLKRGIHQSGSSAHAHLSPLLSAHEPPQGRLYGATVFVILFLLGNFFAYMQEATIRKQHWRRRHSAFFICEKTPSASGSDAFVIHEGTRVDITDSGVNGWKAIRLADGREGWVPTGKIENI